MVAMRKLVSAAAQCLVLALLLTTVSGASEGENAKPKEDKKKKSNPYKELTDESKFGKFVTDHEDALVLFYAPGCKPCKKLMPTFKAVAEELKSSGVTHVARINGEKFKEITEAYSVDGFPTLVAFKKAVPYIYRGDHTQGDIVDFATKVTQPPLKSLNTQEEFDAFVASHNTTAIACFATAAAAAGNDEDEQGESSDEEMELFRKVFFNVASNIHMYSDIYFGVVDNPDVKTGRDPSANYPSVVFNTPDFPLREYKFPQAAGEDGDEQKLSQKYIVQDFVEWLDMATIPVLDEITRENYVRYLNTDKPIVWLVLREMNDTANIEWFLSIAKKHVGELIFVLLNDNLYHDQSKVLGVAAVDVYPSVAISSGRKNYAMNKEEAESLSAETTTAFIEQFLAGELSKRTRSQPLPDPAENAKKTVKDIVALSFQTIALDPTKDVLVKFYASWCKHCKALAPEYERAAELLAPVDSVVFAQIEAAENDIPDALQIAGYPTLILFPATPDSTPVYFEGTSGKAEEIALFVHENAAKKFDIPEALADAIDKAAAEALAKAEEEEEKKKKSAESSEEEATEEEEEETNDGNENIEVKEEL